MVGFVFFPPSPRHLGLEAARALGARVQGRARRSRCRSTRPTQLLDAIVEALQARPAAAARQGDAGARRRHPHALRPAGDEGVADREPRRSRRRSGSTPRSPTGCCSMRARRARRTRPGGLGQTFDWRCSRTSTSACRSCFRAGSTPAMSPRRCASRGAPGVDVSSGVERAPGEKDPDKIRAFIRAARAAGSADAPKLASTRMTVAAAQFLPHRPRRARAFRHLWRPLRRRDADAADPRSGEGLCRRPRPIRPSRREMDGHLTHYVGRPSPLYFAERLTAAFRRRENLLQARGAQPHRRAQGEQRARPDHAGAPHGQAAHHRRDRRRHARRRDRHAVRQVRPALHRLHGRGRRRAAAAQRAAHEDARRRGAAGRVRLAARSRTR